MIDPDFCILLARVSGLFAIFWGFWAIVGAVVEVDWFYKPMMGGCIICASVSFLLFAAACSAALGLRIAA